MRPLLLTLTLVLCLTACVSRFAETPAQRLYAAISDYTQVQKLGIAYKKNCEQFKTAGCAAIVKKIQLADKKATATIAVANLGGGSVDLTNSTRLVLVALTNEVRAYVAKTGE